jgi:hypothetical protein
MVTDWIENRAEIKSNAISDMMRKVLDSVHSTGTRDQYRLRLEPGPKPGTTDIFLTHRGMEERLMRKHGRRGLQYHVGGDALGSGQRGRHVAFHHDVSWCHP